MFKVHCVLFVIYLLSADHRFVEASDQEIDHNEPQGLPRGSFLQRKCSLLKNAYLSDVNLIAMDKDGDQEIIEVIPAHKWILELSSSVFEQAISNSTSFLSSIHIDHISLETLDMLLK